MKTNTHIVDYKYIEIFKIMKNLSVNKFQVIRMFSICILIAISFSCKKDKKDNNQPPVLIARADLNFVDDGETYSFKSYHDKDFKQVILEQDTSLTLRFKNNNQSGNLGDDIIMLITLYNKSGFSAGQVYKASDNIADRTLWLHCTKPDGNYINYYAGNIFAGYNSGVAELKITTYDGNNIKGTFNYTAHSTNEDVPEKELIVSNGAFNCKIN